MVEQRLELVDEVVVFVRQFYGTHDYHIWLSSPCVVVCIDAIGAA